MDCMQQTTHNSSGINTDHCRLKLVNFETRENHISHETQGLSENHLVVRRGKPFKLTLVFRSRLWNPHTESLVLEVLLASGLSERIPVKFSDRRPDPLAWSVMIHGLNMHSQSVVIHVCSPVLSSVARYDLLVHIETRTSQRSYAAGSFVLLCNPWLMDDPVYMPLEIQIQEYIKSDYGLIYMGTHLNISKRPWSFGQYEPGVLEACLKLLQVSPQHLSNKHKDYVLRADPVYLSRVICAMVNCNDDNGIVQGKWQGNFNDGVEPTEWSGSAEILHRWATSNCSPVRYGQCWVFASVFCTVMRVLGIPSRVVTTFNAAHDGDGSLNIEEFYTSRGEKLGLSKDSIWNFHVWAECWMRRPDLGAGFGGWQVVDPTPQEKSAGIYCCGPCPVVAVQKRCLGAPYDTSFIYASVGANVIRMMVRNGLVVGRTVDTEWVGQLIYTKSIGTDRPENLTQAYKTKKGERRAVTLRNPAHAALSSSYPLLNSGTWDARTAPAAMCSTSSTPRSDTGGMSPGLKVSLTIERVPSVGECINMCVTVTNQSSSSRVLMEHVNAQLKEYNSSPVESFWRTHQELHIQPHGVLVLYHAIPPSEYESVLAGEDILNVAVVIKDVRTGERVLDTQEFNISSPQINIEIEGGDNIQMKKRYTAQVSFTNRFAKTLNGAVLTVEGSGLLEGKHKATMLFLQPSQKIEKKVSIMAASSGTKLLMATFSHSGSPHVVSRCFHKVSVITA